MEACVFPADEVKLRSFCEARGIRVEEHVGDAPGYPSKKLIFPRSYLLDGEEGAELALLLRDLVAVDAVDPQRPGVHLRESRILPRRPWSSRAASRGTGYTSSAPVKYSGNKTE